jgi:RHS repeat-associated protein
MSAVINDGYTNGNLSSRERTSYQYNSGSYRVHLITETGTTLSPSAASETWSLKSEISFLADSHNHTGYTQTIRETKVENGHTLITDYTFGNDEILQRVHGTKADGTSTDETLIFGHDGHGSVRYLSDLAGAIVQAFTYAAYGQMLAVHNGIGTFIGTNESFSKSTLGYSGEAWDTNVQQQYLRARFYNPETGRFDRSDDFSGNKNDPQSLHKYAYVHGDPIQGGDPSGMFFSIVGMLGAMSIGSTMRSVHNDVLGNAAGAGFAMYAAGIAGENPFDAFQEEFRDGVQDSLISSIPVFGGIYDLYQTLGVVGQVISSYFGPDILSQLAQLVGLGSTALPTTGSANGMAVMADSSGALSDAIHLARLVGHRADDLISKIRARNLDASQGRILARAQPRAGVDETVRYGSRRSHSSSISGSSVQYNHLNQDAAFSNLGISKNDGISLPMVGSTSNPNTPHYEFHFSLDTFWDVYRPGKILGGQYPTLRQYDQALRRALRHSGYSRAEANKLADLAKKDWEHLPPDTKFQNIPHPSTGQNHR